jgi:hypothetical protein
VENYQQMKKKGDLKMRLHRMNRVIMGTAFAFILLFGAGMSTGTVALAQDRGRDHSWRRQDRDHRGWAQNPGRNRNTFPRVYTYPRVYAYPRTYTYRRVVPYYAPYGGYSRYGGNSYSAAQQSGFHDGFDRGREDARDGRSYNPNNSSHYRNSGSAAYRDGFRRGYDQGYRQSGAYWRR